MNRKFFLSSVSTLLAATTLPRLRRMAATGKDGSSSPATTPGIIPPYLKKGDLIGISSVSGYITPEEIQTCLKQLESWGYVVKVGSAVGKRDFSFGGNDAERAADLQEMIDDPAVKAIMCARGGYGAVRFIDKINWDRFKLRPKWIIGFSDITVIHAHLSRNLGIASIHSKMCGGFPDDWSKAEPIQTETILSIKDALEGKEMVYNVPAVPANRKGLAKGRLVGGNLKTIESLAGSNSDIKTNGKILFVEDTGEYLYSIDRMFWNLKRSGKLDELEGLIVGGFKVKVDTTSEDFGRTVYDIVMEKVKEYKYPVCFDFPVGHQKNNFALKCGLDHMLKVTDEGSILKEL